MPPENLNLDDYMFAHVGDGMGGLLTNATTTAPRMWLDKTPAEILADVNATLERLGQPAPPRSTATQTFGLDTLNAMLRRVQEVPVRGAYWDFDKLIVPWEPWGRLLMREQVRRYMRWYRAKRRRNSRWCSA